MAIYGYVRVSTGEQNLNHQIENWINWHTVYL